MAFTLPRLPQVLPTYPQAQVWWQQIVEAIETQEAGQDTLLAAIIAAQATATTALVTASARMPAVAPVTVEADHAGVVLAGQLPRNVPFKRYSGDIDVTATTAWSLSVLTGSATVTIGAATGVVALTALGSSSTLQIFSVRDGVTLTAVLAVTKHLAGTPAGSGGGSSASDNILANINSAAMAAISDELTVTVGTAGTVTLSAPLTVTTAEAPPEDVLDVKGQWQWYDGAVWVDLAAEVSSDPDCTVVFDVDFSFYYLDLEGTLTVSDSKTGLTPAASEKFRLRARNASGTRVMYFAGTASAVGS